MATRRVRNSHSPATGGPGGEARPTAEPGRGDAAGAAGGGSAEVGGGGTNAAGGGPDAGAGGEPPPTGSDLVAVFGGTFDPVHVGHLIAAEQVCDSLDLDRLHFVPCGEPPHKRGAAVSAAAHRLRMLELAIAAQPRFSVSELEIRRGGSSYTIDTVRHLRQLGAREVLLVIGADSLLELETWKAPEALLRESRVVVVGRPGAALEWAPAEFRRAVTVVEGPPIGIASSDIRRRVREGRSIRYLVPEPVRVYIEEQGLYQRA